MFKKLSEYQFLLEELTKRDFKKKYKRTVLGMVWSVLSPLLSLLVMKIVFTQFFGRTTPHYTTYLFAGNLVFAYFREATAGGMTALTSNAGIYSKVNMPKYMFILSSSVSSLINFILTLVVFFVFAAFDNITFTWKMLLLPFPIICLMVFNIGVGMILSALNVFFRDTQYLYTIVTQLLMYLSAIFYQVDTFPENVQRLFLLNPVYVYIKFVRLLVIDGTRPSFAYFLLCMAYATVALLIGSWFYKKYNDRFMYYV